MKMPIQIQRNVHIFLLNICIIRDHIVLEIKSSFPLPKIILLRLGDLLPSTTLPPLAAQPLYSVGMLGRSVPNLLLLYEYKFSKKQLIVLLFLKHVWKSHYFTKAYIQKTLLTEYFYQISFQTIVRSLHKECFWMTFIAIFCTYLCIFQLEYEEVYIMGRLNKESKMIVIGFCVVLWT